VPGLGKDPHTFEVEQFRTRTDAAICVKLKGHDDEVWLPISQIEEDVEVIDPGDVVTIPEWLAEARGLL
jgi:hypothetical protein